ncbi:MAG: acetylxylan esterase [Acidobacteriota bacterium]|nr:acetylxylan esterase [Acidobacteriota bacterium]
MERRKFLHLSAWAIAAASASVAAQRPVPKSEFDYVDWSWQRWREITGQTRPHITGEQSGKAELVYLHEKQGRTITAGEWSVRREGIERVLAPFLGAAPSLKPALAPKVSEETDLGDNTRRKLTFETEPGERVPAYLLIPKSIRGRAPAVLCPHQTTQAGKKEPAGLAGDPTLHSALHLVRRGYVTITWDALCFGERHDPASGHYGDALPFYRKHPQWSLLGKMIWDASRAIDYLETLDFVDPSRIGSVGHSHGGITTLFGMALDRRIKAGAINCGFDTFRIDGNTWRWSHATALMPRLGFYVSSPYVNMDLYRAVPDSEVIQTPFDMHELLALVAPRPLLLSTSDADFVFPNGGWSARQSLARVEPVYQLLGARERLGSFFFSGGHNFPPEASSKAYDWLDRWLKV